MMKKQFKRLASLAAAVTVFAGMFTGITVNAKSETVSTAETSNLFDSENVMWTDQKIIDGFWEMDPDVSNKTKQIFKIRMVTAATCMTHMRIMNFCGRTVIQ